MAESQTLADWQRAHAPAHQVPATNQGYVIMGYLPIAWRTDADKAEDQPAEYVVLARDGSRRDAWVTWRATVNDQGDWSFYWGHYKSTHREAMRDFAERAGMYSPDIRDATA